MEKIFGKKKDFSFRREEETRTVIGFGMEDAGHGNYTWNEVYFSKKQTPNLSIKDIREAVSACIDEETELLIVSGFKYEGKSVWLSKEKQFNIKSEYDLAVQTGGQNLPLKYKLGENRDKEPVYHTFRTVKSITDFYTQMIAYVRKCLSDGWARKEAIDWKQYERS